MKDRPETVLVIGSSGGIGKAVKQAFYDQGIRIAEGSRGTGFKTDVRSPAQVQLLLEQYASCPLTALVNCFGIHTHARLEDLTPEAWDDCIATNLNGIFYACHYAVPILRRNGGGFICNIASVAGIAGYPGGAAYCAAKAGVVAFGEALLHEVRQYGIRVTTILPASVGTGFAETASGEGWKLDPKMVADAVLWAWKQTDLVSKIELRPMRVPMR